MQNCASGMQQGALLKLTRAPCYLRGNAFAEQGQIMGEHSAPSAR